MPNKKKHRVLSILHDFYKERTNSTTNYTELGKSLSIEELGDKTNFKSKELDFICKSLLASGYISHIYHDKNPDVDRYYINPIGSSAVYDGVLINRLLYKDFRFLIPVGISILAVLTPIFLSRENKSTEERIQKLEQKLHTIQLELSQKIDSISR